jgi:protocatechuate 3,4-dioxygenase, alpha subunit
MTHAMSQQQMQPLMRETASQTAGPYVHIGLAPLQTGLNVFANNFGNMLTNAQTQGQRIRIEGRVLDGIGTVLKDVLIESWQANAQGKYAHPADQQAGKTIDPSFRGWGRSCTDFDTGVYTIDTIKPGLVAGRQGRFMAPHISLWIVARGINMGLNTRLYFSDETDANGKDAVLNLIEWEARRATLVAQRQDAVSATDGAVVYRFDIRLQGEGETVFFDI